MADLPSASVTIDEEAGALAAALGYCIVAGCVEKSADLTPRVFSSAKAVLDQHGYSPAVDYDALHIEGTDKPIIFIGLPTAVDGTVGRQNSSGVTGSSAITVSAGANGYLEETDASVEVVTGGTIGTKGIVVDLSLDGGVTKKRVRLGTANSYTFPYVGIVLNFGAGTLVAGDVFTFTTTAPMWDGDGLAAARTALAAQLKLARSFVIVGDLPTVTYGNYVVTAANTYETTDKRFVLARAQVRDRLPLAAKSRVRKTMLGAPNLTFAEVGATGDTITRSAGSFLDEGFAVGDVVTIAGSVSNNVTGPIAALTATVLTFGTTDLVDEGPVGGCTLVGSEGLTFAEVGATGDTVTRSAGDWLADGFAVGDVVTFGGTASNNVTGPIAALTATVLTFGTTDLAAEVIGSHNVTCVKGETMSAWVSQLDTDFATIDAERRVDFALGRATKLSPITGWSFRRPSSWAMSIREYQHDVQIPCWRKSDGPLDGWSLLDADGNVAEYDERTIGGALAARFSCLRTYSNGPAGTFVALSLTRDTEGAILSRTHNLAVANVACTAVQAESEEAIGQVLVLNADGTGTDASIALIETRVNRKLQSELLENKGEGQRASIAVWKADRSANLSGVGATMPGVLDLELDGTLEQINTITRVR